MNGRSIAIALALLGASALTYALLSRQTDEEKILEVLDRLETAIRVDEDSQNPLMRLAKVNQHFSEIFAEGVTFRIPEHTSASSGRKTLAGLATQIGPYFRHLEVDFESVTIDFEMDNTRARVASNADVDGIGRGGPFKDERRVRFEMSKPDDDWVIDRLLVTPKGETEGDKVAD